MSHKHIPVLVLILILSVFTVFTATPAYAATITVTSKLDTADPGRCRLRDAIIAANTNTATGDCPAGGAGLDTIGFSLGLQCNVTPCTITLTSALPTVTEDLTLNGSNTVINGANSFRVFNLGAVNVNISNLSIANGNVSTNGGAINMSDAASTAGTTLTLNHVFFSNNHANFGGAIYEPRGTLTIISSNFSGNTAGTGGAILEERNGSTLTAVDSIFSSNTAVEDGGAMALVSQADISRSTFSGNSAGFGGAIAKLVLGNLNLSDSVFYNNAASGQTSSWGGAIYIFQNVGAATLTNVTLSGNSSENHGGGIVASVTTTALNNVTITNNTADSDNDGNGDGGGIYRDSTAAIQVKNSIIAGNFDTPGNAGAGAINPDCSGLFSSQGYNLIGRNDGCSGIVNGVNADKVGSGATPINPLLGALANNGGSTQTHALLPGSPAINAGNPLPPGSGGFACAGTDQRGIARPQGGACDMGAFEFEFRSLYLPLILRQV